MNLIAKLFLLVRKGMYLSLGFIDRDILHRANPVVIFSYHSVANDDWRFSINESTVKKQLTYLRKQFSIITLNQLSLYLQGKITLDGPAAVITFDDGYKDITRLIPFFKKQQITPALFILSDSSHFDEKELGTKREFLTSKEIKDLHKAGWEIGCHSATHANLSSVSEKQRTKEILDAKKELESRLGFTVPYFAYPRGKYNQNVVRLVKKAKFQLGLTMDDGIISPESNPLKLPRVGVDRTHSFAEFKNAYSPSVVRFRQCIKRSPAGKYL